MNTISYILQLSTSKQADKEHADKEEDNREVCGKVSNTWNIVKGLITLFDISFY